VIIFCLNVLQCVAGAETSESTLVSRVDLLSECNILQLIGTRALIAVFT